MARHLDSVCQICRREGIKLYLKGSRCDSPKCAIERRDTPPGMHNRRGKTSEYGTRLREKQKLKRFYGVFERQFRRYFELASRSPENTGEVLLSIMERRLGVLAEPYRQGGAGRYARAAKAATALGLGGTALGRGRLRRAGAALILGGAVLERFAIFEAGKASARDPRYTLALQRQHVG